MNRMEYQAPEMKIIVFQSRDIITSSRNGVDLPLDPANDDPTVNYN